MAVHAATATAPFARPVIRPSEWPKLILRCFIEARPAVQVIFLLRFLAGRTLSPHGGRHLMDGHALLAAVVWEGVILSIYLYNGVADVVEDRLNGSARPIASGLLPASFATTVAAVAAGLSVTGAVFLGRTYLTLVLLTLALGYIYTGPPFALKRYTAGAGIIVLGAGLLTFAAGSSIDGPLRLGLPLVIFSIVMSLWMGAVGAIAKDLSDIRGDALAGRRTCVVRSGTAAVRRRVSRNAVLIAVGLGVTAAVAAPQLRPAALGLLIGAVALIICTDPFFPARSNHPRLPYRAFMATQYGVHLIVVVIALG
jgi:4-hydroxybenzoate polyprenyltransferase